MHCDDKRTIFALQQLISDSNLELEEALNHLKKVKDEELKLQIQTKINNLEKIIQDSKDQLSVMK